MTYATSTPMNAPRKYNTIKTDAPDYLLAILSLLIQIRRLMFSVSALHRPPTDLPRACACSSGSCWFRLPPSTIIWILGRRHRKRRPRGRRHTAEGTTTMRGTTLGAAAQIATARGLGWFRLPPSTIIWIPGMQWLVWYWDLGTNIYDRGNGYY